MNQTLLQLCQQCSARRESQSSLCPVDQVHIVQHATDGACPAGLYTAESIEAMEAKVTASIAGARIIPRDAPPALPPAPIQPVEWGPPLWREIHTHPSPDAAYAATIPGRCPCGPCRIWAREWIAENPPDGKWEWGYRFHEAANAKLGKPSMNFYAARSMYPAQLDRCTPQISG